MCQGCCWDKGSRPADHDHGLFCADTSTSSDIMGIWLADEHETCSSARRLALLAGRLEYLCRVPGARQYLAELLLREQLVRLHVLERARASGRDADRGDADRVQRVHDREPVVSAEHPVHALE